MPAWFTWWSRTGDIVLRASQLPHTREIGSIRLKLGEGVTGWVAAHKSVVALSAKAALDKRFKNFPSLVEDTFEAFLSVPLVSGGETIGVINIHHKAPHVHTPEQVALLSFMGEQMGGAIARGARDGGECQASGRGARNSPPIGSPQAGGARQRDSASQIQPHRRAGLPAAARREPTFAAPMRDLAEAIILAEDVIGQLPRLGGSWTWSTAQNAIPRWRGETRLSLATG